MADRVFVAGATGGVGQLAVAKALDKGYVVRVLTRSPEKAQQMFGDRVEIAIGDIRQPDTLASTMTNVDYVLCCTGTTAFPSPRWNFDLPDNLNPLEQIQEWSKIYLDADYRNAKAKNNPQKVDAEGVRSLVAAAPQSLKRFVFISSAGVERKDTPPYNILNAFGVLDAKQQGEAAVLRSGLPYTIIRPGRLIDGPYTSYDLNTLLKAKTDGKLGVVVRSGDSLNGQTSRIDVAAACVECLEYPTTERQAFAIVNQGQRPHPLDWATLFAQLRG
ncbi:MAG: SDR family oxidoreductase [Leptolyngbyaceae cyanobacterium bins.302]|nr:SDR family oxidoreductase [Leptolyngbyaceae cyanobacterium bins.302]